MGKRGRLDADHVLAGCTELAGEVPFLVLNLDGSIRFSSDGAKLLVGGKLECGGQNVEIGAGGLEGGLGPLARRRWAGEVVRYVGPDGRIDAFRIHSQPVPKENPQVVLLRLDPDSFSKATGDGLPVRPPGEFAGAVEFHGLWTRSPEMKSLFEVVKRAAGSDATVLVRGESGTGKERIALAIHELSRQRQGPFVPLNCAALTPSLLESELFGHVKGAFTGAIRDRRGVFEQAHRGTIFLDEIAELPLPLQAKLLRVLQERVFTPVGGSESRTVEVRVLSATHQSLRNAVAKGSFREDLMYRLRVVPLHIPPLRHRRGDIELLTSALLYSLAKEGRHCFRAVHPLAMRQLLDYRWPGNVRELQNALEYATVVGTGPILGLDELPPEFRDGPLPKQEPETTPSPVQKEGNNEADAIRQALFKVDGNKGRAAKLLGVHRTTLWRKMQKYGISP